MKNLRYEPVITFGNIISFVSLLITVVTFIVYNERRMSQHEGTLQLHAYRLDQIQAVIGVMKPQAQVKTTPRSANPQTN